jgi:hypothetical protein
MIAGVGYCAWVLILTDLKIWRTVMNNEHWLVQFKIYIMTTACDSEIENISWFDDFLQIYFIFARFC